MKAIAVIPGRPGSAHLADLPEPRLEEIPDGRGALVRVLRVGVDGTDKEINAAEYGRAPGGYDFLVIGHEGLGRVEAVGEKANGIRPGDLVVATVRRPGSSIYDRIGAPDFTTDDTYFERGINLLHGFLTERYVEDVDNLIKVPEALRSVGLLLEPFSIVQKGLRQAADVQRRLPLWRPRRAAVMGAGTVGLLATLALRLRGLEVTTFARQEKPSRNADLVEALGARYHSVKEAPLLEVAPRLGPFDLIFEATGASAVVFDSMRALAKNGVLVLSSVTGGDRMLQVQADRINLEFVLGNKAMVGTVNAGRVDFETGVRDLLQAETQFPGWAARLLTHPVHGLENHAELFRSLEDRDAIKVFCVVSQEQE